MLSAAQHTPQSLRSACIIITGACKLYYYAGRNISTLCFNDVLMNFEHNANAPLILSAHTIILMWPCEPCQML